MEYAVGKHNGQLLFDGAARLSRLPTHLGVGYDQLPQSRLMSGRQDELVEGGQGVRVPVRVVAVVMAGVDVGERQDVSRSLDAALGEIQFGDTFIVGYDDADGRGGCAILD